MRYVRKLGRGIQYILMSIVRASARIVEEVIDSLT